MQISPPDINMYVYFVHVNAFIDLLALVLMREIVLAPGQSASMNMEWKRSSFNVVVKYKFQITFFDINFNYQYYNNWFTYCNFFIHQKRYKDI